MSAARATLCCAAALGLCACASTARECEAGDASLLGLRAVVYPVPSVTEAAAWYALALGREPQLGEHGYAQLDAGAAELGLDANPAAPSAPGAIVFWEVASAERSLDRLHGLGAEPVTGIQELANDVRLAVLRDPFGNLFGLMERPGSDCSLSAVPR